MMIDSLILYDDDLHKSLLGLSYSFQSMSGVWSFPSVILITIQIRILTLTAVLDPQKTDMQKE